MSDQKRYMIHNTTRKPADLDEAGNDRRTALEKGGHVISFRDEDGKSRMVPAGGAPAFTSKLDQGLISLQAEGAVRIEEYTDVNQALEAHAINADRGNHARAGTTGSSKNKNILLSGDVAAGGISSVAGSPGSSARQSVTGEHYADEEGGDAEGDDDKPASREERMAARERQGRDAQKASGARATKTGEEDHAPRGGREHEGAVNPDGEPNFLAKAKDVVRTNRKNPPAKEGTEAQS